MADSEARYFGTPPRGGDSRNVKIASSDIVPKKIHCQHRYCLAIINIRQSTCSKSNVIRIDAPAYALVDWAL
jgi:hypothetical protein